MFNVGLVLYWNVAQAIDDNNCAAEFFYRKKNIFVFHI